MSRSAVAILSTENLVHNAQVMRQHAPTSKIVAMVKANAYGHGLRSVSQRLQQHVDMLGVASIDEALILRGIGIHIPILLAEGVFEPSELLIAATQGFHVVFHDQAQLSWLSTLSSPLPLQAWLKVDTGMGRLGFRPDEADAAYKYLQNCPTIAPTIRLMSHLACADEKEHPLNAQQFKAFLNLRSSLTGGSPMEYSFCNSAGIFQFPEAHYHYVRPGLGLYGVSPILDKKATDFGLKPVMTLQTNLIATKNFKAGDSIGYGARYTCPKDMPVGIIAFGYGDGYPRTAKDGTPILINGKRCSLAGRVSMDMAAVDLTNCPNAQVGDPAILWGQNLPLEEIAMHTDNSPYDLLTGIQHRVKFHWTHP